VQLGGVRHVSAGFEIRHGPIAGSDRPIISDLAPISPIVPKSECLASDGRRNSVSLGVDDSRDLDSRSLELIAEKR